MVIIIRPVVNAGNDFFEQCHADTQIGTSNLRELKFIPSGTVGLNNNALPAARPADAINVGTDFNCICYEWTPGHAIRDKIVLWIGHGAARTGNPTHFPGIIPFNLLARYALTTSSFRRAQPQASILGVANPAVIDRIVFFTCLARIWVHASQALLTTNIRNVQVPSLTIDASRLEVHEGDLPGIMDRIRDGAVPARFTRITLP